MNSQESDLSTADTHTINETRDAMRGYVAVSACAAGWSPELSVEMGRVAEPAITASLMAGVDAKEALAHGIAQAETMAMIEVFAAEIRDGATPEAAFAEVAEIKRKALAAVPYVEDILAAATRGFCDALERGMSPFAALIVADTHAGAAARLLAKSNASSD